MRFLSLFSGIEAATQAWEPFGWEPAAFAEIEPFPAAVLAHHYPNVPNLGDVTKYQEWPDIGTVDLICGGSPCQDYSIAGQRLGMAGGRGQLTLTYIEIAAWYRPRWLVYENVPGILSSNGGRDFARFLGDLTGQTISVPEGGWKNSGIVAGIPDAFGLAWRVLDAQHVRTRRFPFAVPQRRRRVWVVAYLGDWRRAAAVLFDRESLSGHPAPRREAGQISPTIPARSLGGGGLGTDFDCDGGLIASTGDVAHCLNAGGMGRRDYETETMVACCVADSLTVGANQTTGFVGDVVAHALRGEGFDASEDGTGRGTPLVPVAFDCKGTEVQFSTDGSHLTLRSMGHNNSHQNAGGHAAVAWSIMPQNSGKDYKARTVEVAQPLMAGGPTTGNQGGDYIQDSPWAVRRLVPEECEALQGFPRSFTAIPWRSKPADQCPDGPRYKALGNSWAVNCAEWIAERINAVDALEAAA